MKAIGYHIKSFGVVKQLNQVGAFIDALVEDVHKVPLVHDFPRFTSYLKRPTFTMRDTRVHITSKEIFG